MRNKLNINSLTVTTTTTTLTETSNVRVFVKHRQNNFISRDRYDANTSPHPINLIIQMQFGPKQIFDGLIKSLCLNCSHWCDYCDYIESFLPVRHFVKLYRPSQRTQTQHSIVSVQHTVACVDKMFLRRTASTESIPLPLPPPTTPHIAIPYPSIAQRFILMTLNDVDCYHMGKRELESACVCVSVCECANVCAQTLKIQ